MRQVGLGIFLLLLSFGLVLAEEGVQVEEEGQNVGISRVLVGVHSGLLVPSLNRIEDSNILDNWGYDLGFGLDVTYNVSEPLSIAVQYDFFPIRYHGLSDRSDVRRVEISGRYGLMHHFAGEVMYNAIHFDHSFIYVGGSYDYYYADQTVNGIFREDNEEISYTETARIDKGTIGIPMGVTNYMGSRVGFSIKVKPIFYWWNNENRLQFVTTIVTVSFGIAF
jgi:hypothetical protein